PLPVGLAAPIAKARASFFAPEFIALRDQILGALAAGQPSPFTAGQWSGQSVPRLATLTDLAETALAAAGQHADGQVAAAERSLMLHLTMLARRAAFLVAP